MLTVGTLAIASLAVTTAAHAEIVTYLFTASVTNFDVKEVSGAKLSINSNSNITGSFTYNTTAGSGNSSNQWNDNSLKLTIDNVKETNSWSTYMSVEYNQKTLSINEDANTSGKSYWATLSINGQNTQNLKERFPSSLALNPSKASTLQLYLNQDRNSKDVDLLATLTSLTRQGGGSGSSTPELDPRSGAGALGLLLGGLGMVFARRRSSK